VKLSEAEQRDLGGVVNQLWQQLDLLANHDQDELECYIERMEERASKLPEQPLSYFFRKLVGCIFGVQAADRTSGAYWRALENVFLGFDPQLVSTFTIRDLAGLPGIIRHKGKLSGCIAAAKLLVEVDREFGSFHRFLIRFGFPTTPAVERWSLVCLLASHIPWMGTAAACDFLEEVGLATFAKPDTPTRRALHHHGLTPTEGVDDFTCFAAVDKLAQASGLQPAYVGRMLRASGVGSMQC
jgi:3-methyladenine DNA glycosylase Tag